MKKDGDIIKKDAIRMNASNKASQESLEDRPVFKEFRGAEMDDDGEYREPTAQDRELFHKRVERVSEVFDGADFPWLLDGAINISLLKGSQIRAHKDIDISVFKEDLPRVETFLATKGFGIYVNLEERKRVRRLRGKELFEFSGRDLSVCRVGPDGRLDKESSDVFNYVDLHVSEMDSEGNMIFHQWNGESVFPREYAEPIRKKLQNEKTVNISHPLLVAYHKFHSGRSHDFADVRKLRSELKTEDIAILRDILSEEMTRTRKLLEDILTRMWLSLDQSSALKLNRDAGVVSEILWGDEDVKEMRNDERISSFVGEISEYVSSHVDVSSDDFIERSLFILKPFESFEKIFRELDELDSSKSDE